MDVHYIGKIDLNIYRCITEDIVTDEVIITEERIYHIESHHPGDYKKYGKFLRGAIENPDFILQSDRPNTALILKECVINGEKLKIIVRLLTSFDDRNFKNSVITFMRINIKEWQRLLNNKIILYKKE